MPVRIPNRGEPDIIEAKSTVAGAAKLQDTLTPKVPEMTFAEAIKAALDKNEAAAVIAIDPVTRRITFGTTPEAQSTILAAAYGNSDDVELQIQFTPEPNQSGRALSYNSRAGSDFHPHRERFENLVAAQKPRRTVESLVSACIAGTFGNETEVPVIIVDQVNGTVVLAKRGSNQSNLEMLTPVGDTCTIQLSGGLENVDGPSEDQPAPLVFEGGPTSTTT